MVSISRDGVNKRIKILELSVRSDWGGGPSHLMDLLRTLDLEAFEVSVASPVDPPYGPAFRDAAAHFFPLPHRKFSLAAFFKLSRFIKRHKIDLLHSHGRGAGFYSRPLGWITGTPVVHTFHGIHREKGFRGEIKYWLDRVLSLFPFHAVFVSDSESERASSLKLASSQMANVIWNAVDLSRFKFRGPRENFRQAGTFLRDDFVKGPDLFLKGVACTLSEENTRETKFICAGITRGELERFGEVPPALEVKGKIADTPGFLETLDVFISTSRAEGLPLGVLEAMAVGVPCLLSDIPAHRIFFEKKCAQSFQTYSAEDFALQLERLVLSPANRAQLANEGLRWVQSRHSLETFSAAITKLYRTIAHGFGAGGSIENF